MATNKLVQPFLKWAGGKRQLIKEIEKYIPSSNEINTYYEPFLGGGAVLFHLQPKKAVVNDYNTDLMTTYEVIRDNVDELIEDLKKHKNTSEYFYEIRSWDRKPDFDKISKIKKASRLIYLNKTCFNGLFRVNSNGEFNTPFGNYKKPNIVNEKVLRAVSKYLNENDVILLNCDFENALINIKKGDFVYLDPPYYPISNSSNFTGYTLDGFSESDQVRLKELCDKLTERGIKFLLSNSSAPFILELYKDYKIEFVKARRTINSNGDGRGKIKEVLVRNYE
ncbi:MAG: DNA adenine methylase [Tissierellia bacterium]|mgnify:CR=1 FL=1|nr:DNA adenine methylase [Tissierellia bacterium]